MLIACNDKQIVFALSPLLLIVKFIRSEKATKFCEIFTLLLTVCNVVKTFDSKVRWRFSYRFIFTLDFCNNLFRGEIYDIYLPKCWGWHLTFFYFKIRKSVSSILGQINCTVKSRPNQNHFSKFNFTYYFFSKSAAKDGKVQNSDLSRVKNGKFSLLFSSIYP